MKSHTTSSRVQNWSFSVDLIISARAAREYFLTSNLRLPAKITGHPCVTRLFSLMRYSFLFILRYSF